MRGMPVYTPDELAPRVAEALGDRLIVTLDQFDARHFRSVWGLRGDAPRIWDDIGINYWWYLAWFLTLWELDPQYEPLPDLLALAQSDEHWPDLRAHARALWRCIQMIAERPDIPPQKGGAR